MCLYVCIVCACSVCVCVVCACSVCVCVLSVCVCILCVCVYVVLCVCCVVRHCKEMALSASKEVCVRKNAILMSLSEGVALLVADSKVEQGRWIAALNKVINTALMWKQA